MKLYLVQHGDALSKETDPDRPLSPRGEADVRGLADFLGKAGIPVEQVFHSGKTRAAQTADLLAATLCPGAAPETLGGIDPKDPPHGLLTTASKWNRDTLVVGHLPFMAKAVSLLLTGDGEAASIRFRPGSIACLERDEEGAWGLAWMVRPELLG
jgi:phosphohistidine phosphatase